MVETQEPYRIQHKDYKKDSIYIFYVRDLIVTKTSTAWNLCAVESTEHSQMLKMFRGRE